MQNEYPEEAARFFRAAEEHHFTGKCCEALTNLEKGLKVYPSDPNKWELLEEIESTCTKKANCYILNRTSRIRSPYLWNIPWSLIFLFVILLVQFFNFSIVLTLMLVSGYIVYIILKNLRILYSKNNLTFISKLIIIGLVIVALFIRLISRKMTSDWWDSLQLFAIKLMLISLSMVALNYTRRLMPKEIANDYWDILQVAIALIALMIIY